MGSYRKAFPFMMLEAAARLLKAWNLFSMAEATEDSMEEDDDAPDEGGLDVEEEDAKDPEDTPVLEELHPPRLKD